MCLKSSVSFFVFKHIYVSSGLFEHIYVLYYVEAQPVLSGVFKHVSSNMFKDMYFWCV
jgi:hypothetical protein